MKLGDGSAPRPGIQGAPRTTNTAGDGEPHRSWSPLPVDVAEALGVLVGTAPPAVADRVLLAAVGTEEREPRAALVFGPDTDEQALGEAVQRILHHHPILRGYAETLLSLLPVQGTEDGALDVAAVPLSAVWGALFPPRGTRLVHVDVDALRTRAVAL